MYYYFYAPGRKKLFMGMSDNLNTMKFPFIVSEIFYSPESVEIFANDGKTFILKQNGIEVPLTK